MPKEHKALKIKGSKYDDILLRMGKGEFFCMREKQGTSGFCYKQPCSHYKRTKREAKGWPNPDIPVTLCDEHAQGRIPLTKSEITRIFDKLLKRNFQE